MNQQQKDQVIRMAWEDRTSFDEIERRTGLAEADVIRLMRAHLKPSSFRRWRERVSGRITKHGKRFSNMRDQLKNPTSRTLFDEI